MVNARRRFHTPSITHSYLEFGQFPPAGKVDPHGVRGVQYACQGYQSRAAPRDLVQ